MQFGRSAVVVAAAVCLMQLTIAVPQAEAGQAGEAVLGATVKLALSGDSDLRRLTVSVDGSEVTLSGRLPTLWLKMDAIKRTLKVDGVKTVVSEIELSRQESDGALALLVGSAIGRYSYYTLFDYINGRIRNGVVTLTGSVTPEGRKAEEIVDEVARVRGVREIRDEIVTLPPSLGDGAIRAALFAGLASSSDFDHLVTGRNPPFHIVVHNGVVTLYGRVQSEIESRQLESLVRFTGGVLRVQNNLQTVTKPTR